MRKILIFGNSGSGKSTLAKRLSEETDLIYLDLDNFAWCPINRTTRLSISQSKAKIEGFLAGKSGWVVEGCYVDLLALLKESANEIFFMNLSDDDCVVNAKQRPWEPHKYASKREQDDNLGMLVDWIRQYSIRMDEFSRTAHQAFFDGFEGVKTVYTSNQKSA